MVSTLRRGCRIKSHPCGSNSTWRRSASRMRRLIRLRSCALPSGLPTVRPTRGFTESSLQGRRRSIPGAETSSLRPIAASGCAHRRAGSPHAFAAVHGGAIALRGESRVELERRRSTFCETGSIRRSLVRNASHLVLRKSVPACSQRSQACNADASNELVAIPGADGDALAADRTATAQYGCAALGLHPRTKTVRLNALAAVRLKCALWHENALLFLD